MPDAKSILEELCQTHGWTLRHLPAIPAEDGYLELRINDRAVFRATIPREPVPGFDPYETLHQSLLHYEWACRKLTESWAA